MEENEKKEIIQEQTAEKSSEVNPEEGSEKKDLENKIHKLRTEIEEMRILACLAGVLAVMLLIVIVIQGHNDKAAQRKLKDFVQHEAIERTIKPTTRKVFPTQDYMGFPEDFPYHIHSHISAFQSMMGLPREFAKLVAENESHIENLRRSIDMEIARAEREGKVQKYIIQKMPGRTIISDGYNVRVIDEK